MISARAHTYALTIWAVIILAAQCLTSNDCTRWYLVFFLPHYAFLAVIFSQRAMREAIYFFFTLLFSCNVSTHSKISNKICAEKWQRQENFSAWISLDICERLDSLWGKIDGRAFGLSLRLYPLPPVSSFNSCLLKLSKASGLKWKEQRSRSLDFFSSTGIFLFFFCLSS